MSFLNFFFTFSSATTEPPTSSQVRFNASAHPDVTALWVRPLTTDGFDTTTILLALAGGAAIWVQDKNDHTQYAKFLQTGPPVDKSSYIELPVTWQLDGGIPLTNNQAITLLLVVPDQVGPSVTVPNVVGLTEAAASDQLLAGNLTVGTKMRQPGAVPPGSVAYQAPAAGLAVTPGTPVTLTVSSGPPPAVTVPPTNAVPGDPLANSYETVEEFKAYCTARAHATVPSDAQIAALLIQGTALLDNTLASPPDLQLAQLQQQAVVYAWTQQPSTPTQALAWPRVNERTRNGQPLDPTIVPQGVKDCVSEIVLALQATDLTATDDVAKQGIASVKAGSVAVSFSPSATKVPSDQRIRANALPDAAWLCLVPSWYQWNVAATLQAQGKGSSTFDFAVT